MGILTGDINLFNTLPSHVQYNSTYTACDISLNYIHYLLTHDIVTVENALRELRGVAWPRLLFALDIDRTVETLIIKKCRVDDEKCGADEKAAMEELLKHWLDNDEDATWDKLAKALMSQPPFTRTGAYIYNKYVNNEGMYVVS